MAAPTTTAISPAWFVGRWATDCEGGTNAYRIEKTGPSRVRQVHESGNSYEFEITVKGDVIEMIGDYNGGKQIIRERILDHKKTQYFYHFFDGSEWPAKGTNFQVRLSGVRTPGASWPLCATYSA